MANMMQIPSGVRRCGKANDLPRGKTRHRGDDALGAARGLLAATGLAAAIWAVIGLLAWWIVG
ncbi:MAG TPA: hypothetical protein VLJ20_05120 [Acetobacteraceae bacterium]|nr:hypothetical protein [Acetobacteraceae bacterium]